jgi:hypothetical protein
VKVHYDEGVANRIAPEPCGSVREGRSEASVGARIGQPSSRERHSFWTPTLLTERKATQGGASSRALVWSGVVGAPGMCVSSLYSGNREISCLAGRLRRRAGPCREGEEP